MKKEFIKWTKKLSVGVEDLDEQHKKFIGIIDRVYLLSSVGDTVKLKEEINNIIEFARIHFSTEEEYFKKWKYLYADEHIEEHRKLTLKALSFAQRIEDEGAELVPEFLKFLKEWLENHLEKHDFKYRDYIKENKLK